jgi:hypothetical protein
MPTAKQQMAKFNREAKKLLDKVTSPRMMREIAVKSVEIVRDRTRKGGKGVPSNGATPRKLHDVSPDYADYRDDLRSGVAAGKKSRGKKKRKGPRAKISKDAPKGRDCNLTLTGRMLDTLRPIKVTKGQAEIGWSIEREKKKAGYAVDGDRAFLNLSNKEIDQLSKHVDKKLSIEAKKI